jgi:hypothetical protein
MSNSDFVPRRELEFFDWQGVLMGNASTRYKVWGIPDDTWKNLLALQTDYQNKHAVADNPETRTASAIERRKLAREAYEGELRIVIKGYITYNPVVSDDERKDLRLPVHDTKPTPAPKPHSSPWYKIDSSTICMLRVLFRDMEKSTKAKPDGVLGAQVSWAILDVPPTSERELTHTKLVTHSPFEVEFDVSERGKTVYFCLRWESTRGEVGPISEIISAIIP